MDQLIWPANPSWNFLIQTAYYLLIQEEQKPVWPWQRMWSLKAIQKQNVHLDLSTWHASTCLQIIQAKIDYFSRVHFSMIMLKKQLSISPLSVKLFRCLEEFFGLLNGMMTMEVFLICFSTSFNSPNQINLILMVRSIWIARNNFIFRNTVPVNKHFLFTLKHLNKLLLEKKIPLDDGLQWIMMVKTKFVFGMSCSVFSNDVLR